MADTKKVFNSLFLCAIKLLRVYPIIGELPVTSIDTGLVLEVLQQPVDTPKGKAPFWNSKAETAGRVRGRMVCLAQQQMHLVIIA